MRTQTSIIAPAGGFSGKFALPRVLLVGLAANLAVICSGDAPPELAPNTPDRPPSVVKMATPTYPAELRKKGIEGTVIVDFIVDETGAVVGARITSSPDPALSALVLDEAQGWKFVPGVQNGHYARHHLRVPIDFFLGSPPIVLPDFVAIPDRPGIPITYVDSKPLKIVGYEGADPMVNVGSAKVRKRHSLVSMVPGREFAAGKIAIEDAAAE